ncbi:fibronectin type III domain-containing protein [Saccharothrix longispora]|uniref:fibronectin type III domain-containing protein n=1 Tax=Saccharothrix longispora TaxID=33920 RepID=UPI0028FDAFA3|nr:fibronectin type III domain-containing protein [Saccharothrix longispora]MDU0290407.1 fibronectin type III domain-containing protein [Saccharothrix longispora]
MERGKLIAVVGGLALVVGAVVVLRVEPAPPTAAFERVLDDRVEHLPDDLPPRRPTDLVLTALDRTSLRATWAAGDRAGPGGFAVSWNGLERLVQGTETELVGLDPNAEVAVEVRALDRMGGRSEPVTARAVPRLAHDEAWADGLVMPLDVFDGPAALHPSRWRVFDGGADCLGLGRLNGPRLEVTCATVDLQSNVPLRLGTPADDGAVGRVVLTADGPVGEPGEDGELLVALLPEPFQDLGHIVPPHPPGSVVLRITPLGAEFEVGAGVPATRRVVPVESAVPPPAQGVRHRWELRVLPDAVVALRDGEVVAAAPVAVPWTSASPRLTFREARHTRVDSFGVGGSPESPAPASVVLLGPAAPEGDASSPGNVATQRLEHASSVRVVAAAVAARGGPITVELGSRSAPASFMPPAPEPGGHGPAVVYADFPLPWPEPNPRVRLRSPGGTTVFGAHLVVTDDEGADRPLPRLVDRGDPAPEVPKPSLSVVHESGPPGGTARVVVDLAEPRGREVAAVKGLELDLDGERLVALPVDGSAGGRHEFTVDLAGVPSGRHEVAVRVLPVDQRRDVRSAEQAFEIRPL